MNEKNVDQWSAAGGVEIPTCFIVYQVTTVQILYISTARNEVGARLCFYTCL